MLQSSIIAHCEFNIVGVKAAFLALANTIRSEEDTKREGGSTAKS